jgi:hypothetical protein
MCMLNGKTSFPIPNVPEDHKLVRFNVLFAYVFDAVSGAKGMLNLKIDPSKKQTISNLLHETFPAIKCFKNEKLHVINPKIIAYIHALIIDCISIPLSDSVNSRALEHEATMLEVYSKMTPDAFRTQLQTALTAYYEEIKGIVCASGCTKSKVVKRKFEDHDDIPAPDPPPPAAAAPAAALDAAAAAASPTDGDGPSAGGEEPDPPATSPAGKGGKGAKPAGAGKKGGKGQG